MVAFVDETGNPSLSDPKHRVFGLGGCVVRGNLLHYLIERPWLELREGYFPEERGPLHAASSSLTDSQAEAVEHFFLTNAFLRVACLVTESSNDEARRDSFRTCASHLLANLQSLGAGFRCSELVIVFESVDRRDRKSRRSYSEPWKFGWQSSSELLPVRIIRSRKTTLLPGLEVADFIIHAAGTHVRSGRSESEHARRRFRAAFQAVPDAWVRFCLIDEVSVEST